MKSLLCLLVPLALVALLTAGCGAAHQQRLTAQSLISDGFVGPGVKASGAHASKAQASGAQASGAHASGAVTRRPHASGRHAAHHFDHRLVVERLDIPKDPPLDPSGDMLAVSSRVMKMTVAGQRVVIVVPRHSRHRAILFEHGSGESADLDVDMPPSSLAIAGLVRAGYTWAESNAGFNNWGDAASLRDDVAVAQWLRHHGDPVIDIGGDSMGGLDATQLIPLIHPAAVFELFPVCDERTVVDEFGILMHRADAPLARLSPVAMNDVKGLPMLFTASNQDTIVPKATNADVCAREARAAGARVEEVTTVGEHGNYSNWRPGRLIHFLDAASDRPSGSASARAVRRREFRPQRFRDRREDRGSRHRHGASDRASGVVKA